MSKPIGTDERLDRIEELEARIKELTELCALEYQRAWLLETQKNIAEEKLAQQDDLVQAAVAAALREAANACVNEYLDDPQGTKSDTAYQHAVADCVTAILALITPDAQAALDRVVAAERERIISVYRKLSTGSTVGAGDGGTLVVQYVDPEQFAAAIREGGK